MIKIYNINQYTKMGRLKKNAKTEYSLPCLSTNPKCQEIRAEDIKGQGYHSFTSPYVFTHIDALNKRGERVFITESVVIGSDSREVITSPVSLLAELIKN